MKYCHLKLTELSKYILKLNNLIKVYFTFFCIIILGKLFSIVIIELTIIISYYNLFTVIVYMLVAIFII